jgi:O-antigen ligase
MRRWSPSVAVAAGGAAVVATAAATAWALDRHPLSFGAAVGIGVGLLGILALVLARFDAAVGLGVLLIAVVRFEPAPTDAVFAIVIAVALLTGRFDFRRVPALAIGLIGAFLALNLFSAVEMIDVSRGIQFFAITFYLVIFAVWFAGYVRSPGRARFVLRLYLVSAVASAALALVALFVVFPGHETFVFGGDRAQGLFKDPVVFGPFLIPAALILLEEIARPRLLGGKTVWKAAAIAVLALGVVFSYSRAAWLSFALGFVTVLLVLALRRGGARRALVILSVLLVVLAAVASTLVLTGSTGFLEQRARFQNYDVERFSAQALGIREGERYPFGIGPGQFDVVSTVSAHSTYVRAFAEEGLPGLLTLLALVFATLLYAVRNVLRGVDTFGIGSAALLASWLGLLANSLFVDTLHWRHLWLVAALVWSGAMRRDRPEFY